MLTGVVPHLKERIHAKQGMEGILHREDAAYHHRALGVDVGGALKHPGESLNHPAGYALMLLRSAERQLAMPHVGFLAYHGHPAQHVLSKRGELLQ